jgi:tetratricopeptide (TPR) repeat protein
MKKQWVYNLIFITLPSIFLALLIAEVALRVSGSIYFAARSHVAEDVSKKSNVRILCLGDSFTFGLGTPSGKSYPDQLKKLLKENGYDSVAAYNVGVPGFNSSLVANKLNENIHKYDPNFIIIMVGCNNDWNLEDSSYLLFKQISPNPSDYFERILSKMRIYKLAKIGYLAMKQKKLSSSEKSSAQFISSDSMAACRAGSILFNESKYESAEEYFNKALLLDPHNYNAYWNKACMLATRKDYASAKDALNKAMFLIDGYNEKEFYEFFSVMTKALKSPKERLDMIRSLELQIEECVRDPQKRKKFLEISEAQKELLKGNHLYGKILAYDLNRIAVLAQQKNIKVILLTYPSRRDANDVLREVSRKYALCLVDNERIFKEKSKHVNTEDLFVSKYDQHCSAKGNRLIAENIYDVLVRNNYLSHDDNGKVPTS